MHIVFQRFIDALSVAERHGDFSEVLSSISAAFDLSTFAYLALPQCRDKKPLLISTYPTNWASHYLKSNYGRIDPVITQSIQSAEPFRWGIELVPRCSTRAQLKLFDEASQFGIRCGFTVPIHDGRGPIAALTFAADRPTRSFEACMETHARLLQLMAMYFHAHVRRKLAIDPAIGEIRLSTREFECLEWAAKGKSCWEIGRILGISRHTVASYLENAKEKLGVRTIVQAVTLLVAAKEEKRN